MTSFALPELPPALDDAELRALLQNARTIAVVGWSDKPDRSSHGIAGYLHAQGYDVPLVNPRLAGKMGPFGEPVYRTLGDIPRHVDIVDLFRNASFVPGHTQEAIDIGAGAVWCQAGIVSEPARAMAAAHGIPFVQDTCISVAHIFLVRARTS
ncbi:MAG: CoA-binding protein [Thermomicrobiales bacterium]